MPEDDQRIKRPEITEETIPDYQIIKIVKDPTIRMFWDRYEYYDGALEWGLCLGNPDIGDEWETIATIWSVTLKDELKDKTLVHIYQKSITSSVLNKQMYYWMVSDKNDIFFSIIAEGHTFSLDDAMKKCEAIAEYIIKKWGDSNIK